MMVNRVCHILILGLLLINSPVLAQFADADILFMSDRDGNREIYVMSADGSIVRRLTNHPAEDTDPTWSPDRQQIAFASNRDGEFAIYVMTSDGLQARRISPDYGSYAGAPAWSPDGRKIAFVSNMSGTNQIHTISLDGIYEQQLTRGAFDYASIDPVWSPNGQQLAFASSQTGNYQVFVMQANGSQMQQVTSDPEFDSDSPAWSPDGTRIAYARNGNSSALSIIDLDNPESPESLIALDDGFVTSPVWSSDGQATAFVSYTNSLQGHFNIVSIGGQVIYESENLAAFNALAWAAPETDPTNPLVRNSITPQQPLYAPVILTPSTDIGLSNNFVVSVSRHRNTSIQVEVARDVQFREIVWNTPEWVEQSQIEVGLGGGNYYLRVRQQDEFHRISEWSTIPINIASAEIWGYIYVNGREYSATPVRMCVENDVWRDCHQQTLSSPWYYRANLEPHYGSQRVTISVQLPQQDMRVCGQGQLISGQSVQIDCELRIG